MSRVVLTRIATVTALGDGLGTLWQGLLAGQSGIAPIKRFDCNNYLSGLGACIDGLATPTEGSLLDAVLDRVVNEMGEVPPDCRLLVASTKGEIDRLENACRRGEKIPQAVLFEPLLEKIARRFKLSGRGMNINAACASSTIALIKGASLIAGGHAEMVLVLGLDILSEFVFSGFSALQALSPDACRPFDCHRNGLTLGEAGVALLLMSEERARQSGEIPMGFVAGWGAANDAHHVTAPARDANGLILSIRQALKKADVGVDRVAAINAHGTGTVYNDAMELKAFKAIFGNGLPPVHGVKGSLGHCLGASGGVEIGIACRALQEQKIPGTIGCWEAEDEAQGMIGASAQSIDGEYLLCCNSGFGGVNGAVLLRKGDS